MLMIHLGRASFFAWGDNGFYEIVDGETHVDSRAVVPKT